MSYCPEVKSSFNDQFFVENQPKRLRGGGIFYHLSQVLYGLLIVYKALYLRPISVCVTSGVTHWFVLIPLRLFGIKLIACMHNCLWPNGYRQTGIVDRILLALDGWFFRHVASAVVCVSPEIERQIKGIAGEKHCPIFQFRAQFHRRDFENPSPPPPHDQSPFRVVFAGRIERNKGVFDILEMAEQLRDEGVQFDICGGGSALAELRQQLSQQALNDIVHIHGKLMRPDLLKIYSKGHVVIVPTRSDCAEAFAMVAAEAILLARPAICSSVVPAVEVLQGAAISVPAEDVVSFIEVIRKLKRDRSYYSSLCQGCSPLREQFLDGSQGLSVALSQVYLH